MIVDEVFVKVKEWNVECIEMLVKIKVNVDKVFFDFMREIKFCKEDGLKLVKLKKLKRLRKCVVL